MAEDLVRAWDNRFTGYKGKMLQFKNQQKKGILMPKYGCQIFYLILFSFRRSLRSPRPLREV